MQDVKLEKWWNEAAGYRSGGFDRVMIPAPWTRTIEELNADGVRGAVYAHEMVTVAPGTAADFLELVRARCFRPMRAPGSTWSPRCARR